MLRGTIGQSRIQALYAALCIAIVVSILHLFSQEWSLPVMRQLPVRRGHPHESLQHLEHIISKHGLVYAKTHSNAQSGVHTLIAKPDFDFRLTTWAKSVILVASDRGYLLKYAANILSLDCYSRVHGFVLWVIPSDHSSFAHCSTEKGFFFARHCISASVLERNRNTIEILAVLDADIAVVNMLFDIRLFMPVERDIAFSMRCFNQEVAASSYLVRPSDFAIRFLKRWHTFKFPWNGDNGALHPLLLEYMGIQDTCTKVGEGSLYHSYLRCFHHLVRESNCSHDFFQHVVIWQHLQGWEYDGWVVNYTWSKGLSLMHHAMKNPPIMQSGILPLVGRLAPQFEGCTTQGSALAHVDDFEVSDKQMSMYMSRKMELWQRTWLEQGFGGMQSCLWSKRVAE
eukprot:1347277-Rhodomonas_salina.1